MMKATQRKSDILKKTTSESKKERRKQKTRRNEREHQNSDDFKLYACLKKIIQREVNEK